MQDAAAAAAGILALGGFSIKDQGSEGKQRFCQPVEAPCWVKQQRFPSIITHQPPSQELPHQGFGKPPGLGCLLRCFIPVLTGGELQPGSPMVSVPGEELHTTRSAPHGPSPSPAAPAAPTGRDELRVPLAPLGIRLPALPSPPLPPAPPPPSLLPPLLPPSYFFLWTE